MRLAGQQVDVRRYQVDSVQGRLRHVQPGANEMTPPLHLVRISSEIRLWSECGVASGALVQILRPVFVPHAELGIGS